LNVLPLQNLEKACGPLEVATVLEEIDRILSEPEVAADSQGRAVDVDGQFKCAFLKLHANATRRARW
jgi:hypothetical protein